VFVARSTTFHVTHLRQMMTLALSRKGFTVVEIVSQCPTLYGRYQGLGDGAKMLAWMRDRSVDVGKVTDPWHVRDRFVIGVLHDQQDVLPYTWVQQDVQQRAQARGRG
jgi:2-oxoglutarate ferredoxin oxidoreductase subunit beta